MPLQAVLNLLGIGVEQELVTIEPEALGWLIRSVHAVSVKQSGTRFRQVTVPDLIGLLAQQNAVNFTPPKLIEQAQLNLLRGLGKKGEINAFSVPGGPKWIRSPRPDNRVGLPSQ